MALVMSWRVKFIQEAQEATFSEKFTSETGVVAEVESRKVNSFSALKLLIDFRLKIIECVDCSAKNPSN